MRASDDNIDNALLEVQRLWPPFLGGRRIAGEVMHTILSETFGADSYLDCHQGCADGGVGNIPTFRPPAFGDLRVYSMYNVYYGI